MDTACLGEDRIVMCSYEHEVVGEISVIPLCGGTFENLLSRCDAVAWTNS